MSGAASKLEEALAALIAQDGPISLEHYMALALGHPTLGYYMTRDPLGADGDFTTAPEISQMFGELIGLWAAEAWTAIGAPAPVRLIELGPGRGTMMSDALRAARVSPNFRAALDVHLVETSPVLIEKQKETLANAPRPVTWHQRFDEIPDGPAIILANEFFDALPVRHYVNTPQGWCERQIGLDSAGHLTWGVGPASETALRVDAPGGSIIEVGAAGQRMMMSVAARIVRHGGVALVIDYGHTETATGETLQAARGHEFADPLETPGECDLTAHVDFAALARAARAAGADVRGPVTQGFFLKQIGIAQRAAALIKRAGPEGTDQITSALHRLTCEEKPEDMGQLFKVMAVTRRRVPPLAGFIRGDAA